MPEYQCIAGPEFSSNSLRVVSAHTQTKATIQGGFLLIKQNFADTTGVGQSNANHENLFESVTSLYSISRFVSYLSHGVNQNTVKTENEYMFGWNIFAN